MCVGAWNLSGRKHASVRLQIESVAFLKGGAIRLDFKNESWEYSPKTAGITRVSLNWRRLGAGKFSRVRFEHVARGVYSVTLGAKVIGDEDFEYFVDARIVNAREIHYPATAPKMNNTVIIVGEKEQSKQ